MGTGSLITVSDIEGESNNVTSAAHWNQYIDAISGDILPRNSSGVVENEAGSLGDATNRWNDVYVKTIYADNFSVSRTAVSNNAIMANGEMIVYSKTFSPRIYSSGGVARLEETLTFTSRGFPVLIAINLTKTEAYSMHLGLSFSPISNWVSDMPPQMPIYIANKRSGYFVTNNIINCGVGENKLYLYARGDISQPQITSATVNILIREVA